MTDASPSLTEGSTLRPLLTLSGPIILANILQTIYQLADTFWVGRLGADAVAAVSLSFPVLFLMIAIGSGVAVAGTILVAQNEGRGDRPRVNYVSAQTLLWISLIAALLSVVGYVSAGPLMRLVGAGGDVLPLATGYMQVAFTGLVFLFIYLVFQALLRGVGDVKTPLHIVFGTVALNFALDPFFIMGYGPFPRLGVEGAALATVLSRGVGATAGVLLLLSGRYAIDLSWGDFKPDLSMARRMVRLGFPASVEQSTRALGLMFMIVLVAAYGSVIVAAYGIGTRILSFVIIPALGLSRAAEALVGQNVGAGKPERAERTALTGAALSFGALSAAGALLFLFAQPVTAVFIPDSPEVIASGSRFLRIMALSFGFIGVQQVLGGAFRGAGSTMIAMMLAVISLWVLRFPVAFLLSERTALGAEGLWWSFPISNVVAAVVAYMWFRRGTWKGKAVTRERKLQEEIMGETEADVEGYE